MKASSARRRTKKANDRISAEKRRKLKEDMDEREQAIHEIELRANDYYKEIQEEIVEAADDGERSTHIHKTWLAETPFSLERREAYSKLMESMLRMDGYKVEVSRSTESINYSDDYGRVKEHILGLDISW